MSRSQLDVLEPPVRSATVEEVLRDADGRALVELRRGRVVVPAPARTGARSVEP